MREAMHALFGNVEYEMHYPLRVYADKAKADAVCARLDRINNRPNHPRRYTSELLCYEDFNVESIIVRTLNALIENESETRSNVVEVFEYRDCNGNINRMPMDEVNKCSFYESRQPT